MSMFCFQCQEAAKNQGCTLRGVCGKSQDTAKLQDLLIYTLKGISYVNQRAREKGATDEKVDKFIIESLFSTLTNVNFDEEYFVKAIEKGLSIREEIISKINLDENELPDAATWKGTKEEFLTKAEKVGILSEENEDIRSLKELLTYGVKGIAAYAYHAYVLGYKNEEIFKFIEKALAQTLRKDIFADELFSLAMECGKYAVETLSLLDTANTSTYGNPEITKVNIGVRNNPGILISGHDLKDLEELLEQTKGTGVDVYTHGEMLPAHYYPAFKKYPHFAGNYGNAWWMQDKEFESFNGPIIMTTNCLVPPKESYKDRLYTTNVVGFEGVKYIPTGSDGKKDFSQVIDHAKKCQPPVEIEKGEIIGGFAHNQVLALADKVIEAVKTGAIKKFVVMAGCDGRMKSREYYTEFAKSLPEDTVILTAGCAKYRYNKLNLGDINGIPRVLDAGQCNDSYSLAVIALKLKEVFGLNDINELPIVYNIAWYEQKAVAVLLALLYLGVKNIHLGPTLPAFLSPGVAKVLVEKFNIGGISDVQSDLKSMIG
ncbi:hydroxylamine reductase [Thermovenabulum gondwanense]|uniref:Hydroxylamine reductase n=1 Tax=Thermovenabulum gondwanense TaxID=520767 RepID=A0A161QAY9_9FIRM|nr:hydroxylamine reductase [Thermovenabulum gondwanense]KYO65844.1 Hydroxylamine reductase [Thermovenabulum gondwanense]